MIVIETEISVQKCTKMLKESGSERMVALREDQFALRVSSEIEVDCLIEFHLLENLD